ncbi:12496_t:CDS:2 [Cetraspora pellucida]|uniref:12496_t:CDS:1 n=1 Tax=Cetraspora pellucida TaxID=1433469 RepID=A0A9N9CD49_9GLOM|nr:12496_t:CDS:2 [Cetraspora pellucida]
MELQSYYNIKSCLTFEGAERLPTESPLLSLSVRDELPFLRCFEA